MEDRSIVGPDQDAGQGECPGRPPRTLRLVIALEEEARGDEADPDARSGQDSLEAGLVETRADLPNGRTQVESLGHPADRGRAAQGEKAGQGQGQQRLDERESSAARGHSVLPPGQDFQGKERELGLGR